MTCSRYSIFNSAVLVCIVVAAAGCKNEKAEEAKAAAEQAAASATAAAAAAQEAEAKAKEEAANALSSKKDELKAQLTSGVDAYDRKIAYLKDKANKLPGAAKKKADEAFAAYDKSKTAATALLTNIDSATDASALPELATKIGDALKDAGNAVDSAEAAAIPKKK
ncbi:MAG TPA: hypothetical protein VI072_31390 [Polyangiaceae bacterium]